MSMSFVTYTKVITNSHKNEEHWIEDKIIHSLRLSNEPPSLLKAFVYICGNKETDIYDECRADRINLKFL